VSLKPKVALSQDFLLQLAKLPDGNSKVDVKMTLTAPGCPVAGSLPGEVEAKVRAVEGVTDAKVELVWDPPWNADMMSRVSKVMRPLASTALAICGNMPMRR